MAKKTRIVSKEVAVLLRRIKKDLDAKLVYVLVDHLRETDHPLAKYVADKVERHGNMVDYWKRADMTAARLSRNEKIRRWDKWLVHCVLKAFGPFTTSAGPSWEKRILDSAEELAAMRTRVRRLETAIENRARKTLAAAKKHAVHLIRSVGGRCPPLGVKIGIEKHRSTQSIVVGRPDTMRQYPAIRLSNPQPPRTEEKENES